MIEVEHERDVIKTWPDGSSIVVDRYRTDHMAPWIFGRVDNFCGPCCDLVGEFDDVLTAQVEILMHREEHADKELLALRAEVTSLRSIVRSRLGGGYGA